MENKWVFDHILVVTHTLKQAFWTYFGSLTFVLIVRSKKLKFEHKKLSKVVVPCNGRNLIVRPIGHLEAGKLAHLNTADVGETVVTDLQPPEAGHLGLDPQFFEVVVAEAKGLEGPEG